MQNASFNFGKNLPINEQKVAIQNGQTNSNAIELQKLTESNSIFSKEKNNPTDINQSNSNSQGTGGIDNIFSSNGFSSSAIDSSSIFAGIKRGSRYALYSKKDTSFDVPKLTQEDIAAQKAPEGPKKTNPKPYKIDMTPKVNPYEAYRNPEMQENSFSESIGNLFSNLFGQKKTD